MTSYLNAGGNLFVSGSEIAWDLDRTGTGPTSADRDFFHNVLRAVYSVDDANAYAFAPSAAGIFAANASSGFDNGTRGTYNVDFPDVLLPTNGSVPCITYAGGTGGNAALTYDGSLGGGKIVNWGFPFETVTNSAVRDAYMSDVLKFFGLIPAPTLSVPVYDRVANKVTLSWTASAGLTYRVQYATDLNAQDWQPLVGDVTATNTIATKVDSPGVEQRFYRVVLVN